MILPVANRKGLKLFCLIDHIPIKWYYSTNYIRCLLLFEIRNDADYKSRNKQLTYFEYIKAVIKLKIIDYLTDGKIEFNRKFTGIK